MLHLTYVPFWKMISYAKARRCVGGLDEQMNPVTGFVEQCPSRVADAGLLSFTLPNPKYDYAKMLGSGRTTSRDIPNERRFRASRKRDI